MDAPTVVILEGNAFQRRLMCDLVSYNDMHVVAGESADRLDSAIAWGGGACVLVIDLDLPDGRALDVIRELRSLPERHRPRIIALAENTGCDEAVAARAHGVEDVLGRPIDTGAFPRLVARHARLAIAES